MLIDYDYDFDLANTPGNDLASVRR